MTKLNYAILTQVIGLMKDDLDSQIMKEFVSLRLKMYLYKKDIKKDK